MIYCGYLDLFFLLVINLYLWVYDVILVSWVRGEFLGGFWESFLGGDYVFFSFGRCYE